MNIWNDYRKNGVSDPEEILLSCRSQLTDQFYYLAEGKKVNVFSKQVTQCVPMRSSPHLSRKLSICKQIIIKIYFEEANIGPNRSRLFLCFKSPHIHSSQSLVPPHTTQHWEQPLFLVVNPALTLVQSRQNKLVQLVIEVLCHNKWAYIHFSNGKY